MIIKYKRLILFLAVGIIFLLFPIIGMQFSNAVNWSTFDFIILVILLFGTGFLCEYILRRVKSTKARILFFSAVVLFFFFIWVELAVGIFGTPFAGS